MDPPTLLLLLIMWQGTSTVPVNITEHSRPFFESQIVNNPKRVEMPSEVLRQWIMVSLWIEQN